MFVVLRVFNWIFRVIHTYFFCFVMGLQELFVRHGSPIELPYHKHKLTITDSLWLINHFKPRGDVVTLTVWEMTLIVRALWQVHTFVRQGPTLLLLLLLSRFCQYCKLLKYCNKPQQIGTWSSALNKWFKDVSVLISCDALNYFIVARIFEHT